MFEISRKALFVNLDLNPEKILAYHPLQHMVVLAVKVIEVFFDRNADRLRNWNFLFWLPVRIQRRAQNQDEWNRDAQTGHNHQIQRGLGINSHSDEHENNGEEDNREKKIVFSFGWTKIIHEDMFLDDLVNLADDLLITKALDIVL